MPRFVKLTLAAMALVVSLTGTLLVVALFVLDDEDYLDIAKLALETLGWTLEVRGPVSVDRSLTLAITGQDPVMSRSQTRLAAAKQATFRLELPALLRGQFRFAVDVQEPDVQFTIDRTGKTNWNFEQFAGEGGGFPLEVVIDGIRTGTGQAFVQEKTTGTAMQLALDRFVFRETAKGYEFLFSFLSAYEGHDFRADGKVGVDYAFNTLFPDFVIDLQMGADERPSAASPEGKSTNPARRGQTSAFAPRAAVRPHAPDTLRGHSARYTAQFPEAVAQALHSGRCHSLRTTSCSSSMDSFCGHIA